MLRTTVGLLALLGLTALLGRGADPDPEPPAGAAEQGKLRGTWTVIKALSLKREVKAPAGMTFTFDGDKLTRQVPRPSGKGGRKILMTVKIDTRKKPHRIEMIPANKGQATVGIYKIEKGQLFLVLASAKDEKVPSDFSGATRPVLVLTRGKAQE